jgi:hypothetical protein
LLRPNELEEVLQDASLPRRDKILLILAVAPETPKAVRRIIEIGLSAGLTKIAKWNISDLLASAQGLAIRLPNGWKLTRDGLAHVAKIANIEAPGAVSQKAAGHLRTLLTRITDTDTQAFVEEAILCCEHKHFRAAVVLSWAGAVSVLQGVVLRTHLAAFNSEAKRRFASWQAAKTKDDLGRMKEYDFLQVLEALSIIGKNVREELQNLCLKLRNGCGHPNSLQISESRVAAHIEILVLNVFSKFV